MSDVPDLSQFAKPDDEPPKFKDLTEQEREVIRQMAEADAASQQPQQQALQVTTAFLVAILPDGNVVVSPTLDAPIELQHEATPAEILGACAFVQADVSTGLGAQKTQHVMAQMGQALKQQAEEARIRAQMQQHPGPGQAFRRP